MTGTSTEIKMQGMKYGGIFGNSKVFSENLNKVSSGIYSFLYTLDGEIDYDKIQDIFKRGTQNISDKEFSALYNLVRSYVKFENEEYILDIEGLQEFLNLGYPNSSIMYNPGTDMSTLYIQRENAKGVFEILSVALSYEARTELDKYDGKIVDIEFKGTFIKSLTALDSIIYGTNHVNMSCEYGAEFNKIVIEKKLGKIQDSDSEEETDTWIYNIFLNDDNGTKKTISVGEFQDSGMFNLKTQQENKILKDIIKKTESDRSSSIFMAIMGLGGDTIVTDTAYKIAGKYAGAVSLGLSMAKAGMDEDLNSSKKIASLTKKTDIDNMINNFDRSHTGGVVVLIDEDFAIIRNTHSNKKQLLIDSVYNSYYRSDKNYDWRAIPSEVNNYASGNNSNLLKYVSINPDYKKNASDVSYKSYSMYVDDMLKEISGDPRKVVSNSTLTEIEEAAKQALARYIELGVQ